MPLRPPYFLLKASAGASLGFLMSSLSCLAHREVHVDVLRRDRRQEPLGVELLELAALHHPVHGVVGELLELRIVLADHDRDRLDVEHLADDRVLLGFLGAGDEAGQEVVVHHEGHGPVGLQEEEGVGVVLPVHLLEVDVLPLLVGPHELHRRGPRGGGHRLPVELAEARDPGALLHRHPHVGDEGGVDEGDLLLARLVVGGGAALEVHRAVADEGDPVLGGHGLVLDLEDGSFSWSFTAATILLQTSMWYPIGCCLSSR